MACKLDLTYGALAATAAHADENRADDRGGRDQAGQARVQGLHRHRRRESYLTSRDGRLWIRKSARRGCAAANTANTESQESNLTRYLRLTIGSGGS